MLDYGASSSDRNKGLMAFWQEYNKGCGNSMTDSYINTTLIPAVLNFDDVNVNVGTEVLNQVFDMI